MPCIQIQSYDWITSERERYPILWAAYSGDLAGLQRHLANVKDVTGVNDVQSKTSVLGWAVVGDQVATIKYLVDKYPKLLTLTNKYEASSIFLCSVSGNVDMFKLLAAKGLSPHKRIANLDNVLMLTAARGHLELTRHIVKTYPDMLKQTSKYKIDVFLYSCYSGSIEMFDYMLQLNFDPKVSDIDGVNCLMIAAYCGHELLLRYILDNASKFSIDITKSDDDGLTALSYSMIRNHTDISQILETYDVKSPGWFRILSSVPLRWLTNSRKEAKPELTIDEYLSLFSGRTEKYRHIRVVFVGPENVGKTTLCLRLQNKDVDISVRRPTLGAELFLQLYEIGWDSKRWTHLHTSRPEEVIHKRLGGMLRNTTVLSDNKGKDNAEKEVVPSVDETSNIAVKSKTEEQTLPEPSTTDTETVRPNLKKEKQSGVASFFSTRKAKMMVLLVAVAAIVMSMTVNDLNSSITVSMYLRVLLLGTILTVCVRRAHQWLFKGRKEGRKVSEITYKDESEEVYNQSRQQNEEVAFLSIWDMGGDLAFQATNAVFVSAHGVYIITFRAIDYFTDDLQIERLKNWVRNVGAYSSRVYNPSKLRTHHPPIIIVGTHLDQVNAKFRNETADEKDNRLQKMRLNICSITELTNAKKEEGFVFLRFCTVDNSIHDDPAFEKIREYILEAAVYQDQWERELPGSWLALEREILKQREWKHVMTIQEIKELDDQCEYPIGDEENIKMFLEYLHSTRSVLYFRQYGKVIINPQWVINAFREILTDEKFLDPNDLLLTADLNKYSQSAILTVDLAKTLWKSKKDGSYIQHVDILFAFLEEFGLLVKACLGQDQQGNPIYDDDYTVPSKLQNIPDMNQISDLLNAKGTVCSRTLCFVFQDVFTPQELFERIYAGVIKAFRPAEEDSGRRPHDACRSKQIYKGLGCFKIDDLCNMVVRTQWEQSVIAVTLFTTSEPRIPEDTGLKVRQTLETIIRHTLEVSRQDHLRYRHQLHCRFYLEQSDSPREGDGIVRAARGLSCQGVDCSGAHVLTKRDWHVWFPVSETVSQAANSGNAAREYDSELLTDKGLQENFAVQLGASWECVMTCLDIPRYTVDRIKMDNPHCTLTQITKALIHWRDTLSADISEEEMLRALSEAFRESGADRNTIDKQLELFVS